MSVEKIISQKIKINGSYIEVVTYTPKYKNYGIEKMIIKYLHKIPKKDLNTLNIINIYDDVPSYFPKIAGGSFYPKELKGKSEIDIYLDYTLPYILTDELFAKIQNKLFFFLFGELFIASTLFHEIGHHKYTEVSPKQYKAEEESEKDARDYATTLLWKVFPFRYGHYDFFNALYKILYRKRIKKAEEIRSKPRQLTPEYYEAQGETFLRLKEYEKAIIEFTDLINLIPNHPHAYFNRGYAYAMKEKYDEAITDLSKAINLNSDDIDAYRFRGTLYEGKQKYDMAIEDFTHVINLTHGDDGTYFERGWCYHQTDKYEDAIKDYTKALELHADKANVCYNLACVYSLLREADRACNFLKEAVTRGYSNFEYMKKDPDLINIREKECYQKIIVEKGSGG